jgi:hypothetical protein
MHKVLNSGLENLRPTGLLYAQQRKNHFQDANLTASVFESGVSNDLPVHYTLPSQ